MWLTIVQATRMVRTNQPRNIPQDVLDLKYHRLNLHHRVNQEYIHPEYRFAHRFVVAEQHPLLRLRKAKLLSTKLQLRHNKVVFCLE